MSRFLVIAPPLCVYNISTEEHIFKSTVYINNDFYTLVLYINNEHIHSPNPPYTSGSGVISPAV